MNTKILMLGDMAARGRSFWGWSEEEWLASIKKGQHAKLGVAAIAYLLCEFDSIHKLGRRNFVFHGLATRIFGRERVRRLFTELEAMLVQWGYRDRTARVYVPRVMCEVLVTNRSPHLEDLKRRVWGWRLAVAIIATQVLGDLVNAFMGDLVRGGVGFIIAGALLVYLLRPEIRASFSSGNAPNVR